MNPPYEGAELDNLKEKLAAIEHQRWSDWQKWCHKILRANVKYDIEPTLARWEKQIATPYLELTRQEQISDLEQVDRYWPLILEYFIPKAEVLKELEEELEDGFTDSETIVSDALLIVHAKTRNQLRKQIKSNLKLMEAPSEDN